MEPLGIKDIKNYYTMVDLSSFVIENEILAIQPAPIEWIMRLFADNAIYDREGSGTFAGKNAIAQFFSKERPLVGKHIVAENDIRTSAGVDAAIAEQFRSHFPHYDLAQYKTIKVMGRYEGNHYRTKKGESFRNINEITNSPLAFTDYWVLCGDQVLYRYSNIKPIRQERTAGECATR